MDHSFNIHEYLKLPCKEEGRNQNEVLNKINMHSIIEDMERIMCENFGSNYIPPLKTNHLVNLICNAKTYDKNQ